MAKRAAEDFDTTEDGHEPSPKKTRRADSFRFLVGHQIPGIVIGKGGVTVNGIKEETGVNISISKGDSKNADRVMDIRGDASKAAHAMHLISQLVDQNNTANPENLVSTDMQLLIHQLHAGAIIGKAGATVKRIMEETGSTVRVSNEAMPGSTDKMCTLGGSMEQVRAALTAVLEILEQNPLRDNVESVPFSTASPWGAQGAAGPGAGYEAAASPYGSITPSGPETTTEVSIPTIAAGAVIGKGGHTVANIKAQSGCTISLSEPVGDNRSVQVKGPSGGVCIALSMIRNLVSQGGPGDNSVESSFSIPTAKCGQLIGKGGRTIRDIKTRTGTRISLAEVLETEPHSRIVTVVGSEVAVQCATFEIRQKVEEEQGAGDAHGAPAPYGAPAAYGSAPPAGPAGYPPEYMQQYMQQYQAMAAYYGGAPPGAPDAGRPPAPGPPMPGMGGPPPMPGMGGGGGGGGGMGGALGGESSKRITIPSGSAGAVIGRRGATIDNIKTQSGCRISIDPVNAAQPEYRAVNIMGSDAGMQIALSLISQYAQIF